MCSSARTAPGSACRDHKVPCTAPGPRAASAKGSTGTTGLPQFAPKEMIPGGNHSSGSSAGPNPLCCGGHLGGLGQGGCRTVLTHRRGAGHCSLLRVSLKQPLCCTGGKSSDLNSLNKPGCLEALIRLYGAILQVL